MQYIAKMQQNIFECLFVHFPKHPINASSWSTW